MIYFYISKNLVIVKNKNDHLIIDYISEKTIKKRMIKQISLFLMILIMIVHVTNGHDDEVDNKKKPTIVMEKLESIKSVSCDGAKLYWEKVKMGVKHAHGYFFDPPTLDFRGSEDISHGGEKGAGKKMQEAVTKSLEKTKSSVEDSAKSAAHTVHQTAQKIKESVSSKSDDHHYTSDL